MNKKYVSVFSIIIIFFLGLSFLVGHFSTQSLTATSLLAASQIPENIKYVEIGGQKIKVDLALTRIEQTQGLSGRKSLLPDTGMLFIFNTLGKPLFWMKDMNFSIDMIWLTSDMKVDYMKKNATPESYPSIYGPGVNDRNAKYVLEVPAGFSDKNNLKIGDSVIFTY